MGNEIFIRPSRDVRTNYAEYPLERTYQIQHRQDYDYIYHDSQYQF